jgi:hypothetical protein
MNAPPHTNANPPLWPLVSARRRRFLVGVAAAGLTAALGDALLTYPPWLDYHKEADQIWDTPFRRMPAASSQMRELIRYATLAPSGHNAQPWKFAVFGNTIRIYPDYSRRLPVVDPQYRELWISLGCALENLVIAAQNVGYETEVTYPELDTDYLTLHLGPLVSRRSVPHSSAALFEAVPHRQNTRSLYDGRAVPLADLGKIAGVTAGPGVFLQMLTAPAQREAIIEYIKRGDQSQYGNQAFISELVSWLRFNRAEALHSLDGLYTECSGSPELPRWLGRSFVNRASAGTQSALDEKNARSSSGLIVIAAAHDDKRHWIETGRLYERLALTLTSCGVKMAFLNQPLEVTALRSQLQTYLNLGAAQPQLLLRFGYADAMPRSLRRPVEHVIA